MFIKVKLTGYEDQCSKIILKDDEKLINTFHLFETIEVNYCCTQQVVKCLQCC